LFLYLFFFTPKYLFKDPNKRYSASLLYEKLEKIKKINNNNNTASLDFVSFLRALSLLSNQEFPTINFFDNNKNSDGKENKSFDFIKEKYIFSNITSSNNVESHSPSPSSQISNNISYSDNIKESFFDSIEFL
jgi:hypothetical protein